jgi:hypothetical protein
MKLLRQPSESEAKLMRAVLAGTPIAARLLPQLEDLLVTEMDDDGMGSLLLVPTDAGPTLRSMGAQVAEAEAKDSDGVPIVITINTDSHGRLFELDMWKVEFNPLVRWPEPADIKIVQRR